MPLLRTLKREKPGRCKLFTNSILYTLVIIILLVIKNFRMPLCRILATFFTFERVTTPFPYGREDPSKYVQWSCSLPKNCL